MTRTVWALLACGGLLLPGCNSPATSQGGETLLSETVVPSTLFAIHAANGRDADVRDLGISVRRRLINQEWDDLLGDIPSPLADILDPGRPWPLDDLPPPPGDFETLITLRAMSDFWGNAVVNGYQAVTGGLGIGSTGYPDRPDIWLAIVDKLVERYDGDGIADHPAYAVPPEEGGPRPVRFWQVENEFMTQWFGDPADLAEMQAIVDDQAPVEVRYGSYLQLLEETAAVIRAQDPNAVVIGGAYSRLDALAFAHGRTPADVSVFEMGGSAAPGPCRQDDLANNAPPISVTLEELLASPGFARVQAAFAYLVPRITALVDGHDYHHYENDWRFEQPMLEELRALIGSASDPLILSLENGGPFHRYTVTEHAASIVKRHLLFLEGGGRMLAWSTLSPTPEWSIEFQNLALLDCSGNPRTPPYHAYRELRARLPDGALVRRWALDGHPDLILFVVEGPPAVTAFLWRAGDAPVSLVPADLPSFEGESVVRVGRISSATATGLDFDTVLAHQALELDDSEVWVVAPGD